MEAAAVEAIHAAAIPQRPCEMPSEASFVATPLHAKPRPAPTIVSDAGGRRTRLTR